MAEIIKNKVIEGKICTTNVLNGGNIIERGLKGQDGENGADGISPTVTVKTQSQTEYILTVTDKNGSYDTPNLQGQDGEDAGDMLKSVYDKEDDGIVDNSKKLGGQLPEYYAKSSDIAEKLSDLVDDTLINPIDKSNTLTGLNATIRELNCCQNIKSNIQEQLNNGIFAQYTLNKAKTSADGKAGVLSYSGTTLSFATSPNLVATFKDETKTFTSLPSLNVASTANGTYTPFIKQDGTTELTGEIFVQAKEPSSPSNGDVWRDSSVMPLVQKKYNGEEWVEYNAVDCGKITVTSGVITAIEQPYYNNNGAPENRAAISGLALPDYSSGISVSALPYTAPFNCMFFAVIGNSNSQVHLSVNGIEIATTWINMATTVYSTCSVPLSKGDIATINSGGTFINGKAFPLKGAN